MSTKAYTLILIGAGIILLVGGIFIGTKLIKKEPCPEITDSIYVVGDTVLVPYPVEVIKWKEKQVGIPNVDSTIYTAIFDSQFVSHKDTIGIKAEISFNDNSKEFGMDMDIEHRDVEIFRTDTIKINYTEIREIEVDNPLWIWTTVISGLLLILSIIFGG